MSKQVKRVEMAHFLNTAPGVATAAWNIIGEGHPNLSTSYNAETETQQWINQSTGSTTVKSYAPSIGTEQIAHVGDPVFDFVDKLSWDLAVGSDAETEYLEVRIYNAASPSATTYPARKSRVSISIDSEGDAATDPLSRSYNINFMGDPVYGTFNPTAKTFTATV